MAIKTVQQIRDDIAALLADNTSGDISAADVRQITLDSLDTLNSLDTVLADEDDPTLNAALNLNEQMIVMLDSAKQLAGLIGVSSTGSPFIVYSQDGSYDLANGALLLASGRAEIYGSSLMISGLGGMDGQQVYVNSEGVLYTVAPPAPGWEVKTTNNQDYIIQDSWVEVVLLETTIPEDTEAGVAVHLDVEYYVTNDSNKPGQIVFGYSVNNGTISEARIVTLTSGFADTLAMSFTDSNSLGLTENDTVQYHIKEQVGNDNGFSPVLEGTVQTSKSRVYIDGSSGGGTGEAVWGAITGTLSSQTDLWNELTTMKQNTATNTTKTNRLESINPGFYDLDESYLEIDSTTFSLNPTNTDFVVNSNGVQLTLGLKDILLGATAFQSIIYLTDTGVLTSIDESLFLQDPTLTNYVCTVARISRSSSGVIHTTDLRNKVTIDAQSRNGFIEATGVTYVAGLSATNDVETAGLSEDELYISLEEGQVSLAGRHFLIGAGSPKRIPLIYKYNTEYKRSLAEDVPLIYSGTVDYAHDGLAYNPITGGVGDLVQVPYEHYVIYHYFASMAIDAPVFGAPGFRTFTTLDEAVKGIDAELAGFYNAEPTFKYSTPIFSVVLQSKASYTNGPKAVYVPVAAGQNNADTRTSKGSLAAVSDIGLFEQETFSVFSKGSKNEVVFDLDSVEKGGLTENQTTQITMYEDVNMRLVPQYKLKTVASTDLSIMQEVSLDINGHAQAYPATGGAGSQTFTTRTVVHSAMQPVTGDVGIVGYTEAGSSTLYYRPGVAQPNGSILWGDEAAVGTSAEVIEISTCQIDSTYVVFSWVQADGKLMTQIVNTDGTTVSGGSVHQPDDSGVVVSAGVGYSTEHHLVWIFVDVSGVIFNQYGKISGNNLDSNDYSAINSSITGDAVEIKVHCEGDSAVYMARRADGAVYFREVRWDKPTFGTGRYDDFSGEKLAATGTLALSKVFSYGRVIYGMVEDASTDWRAYYAPYSAGSSINTPAACGIAIEGKVAAFTNSSSGLLYALSVNDAKRFEVRSLDMNNPANGFSLIYTGVTNINSVIELSNMNAVIFGATYAMTMYGDPDITQTIYFIDSSATRTDNYVGNAAYAVTAGQTIDVLLGLPIICQPASYTVGDVFFLGPYKYQVIAKNQVVIIIEATIFP